MQLFPRGVPAAGPGQLPDVDLEEQMALALSAVDLDPALAGQAAAVCAEVARQVCRCGAAEVPSPAPAPPDDLPAAVPRGTTPADVTPVDVAGGNAGDRGAVARAAHPDPGAAP